MKTFLSTMENKRRPRTGEPCTHSDVTVDTFEIASRFLRIANFSNRICHLQASLRVGWVSSTVWDPAYLRHPISNPNQWSGSCRRS